MSSTAAPSFVIASSVLAVLLPSSSVLAGTLDAPPVIYELREGSMITDSCLDCEQPPIQEPLIGTFALTRVESPLDFETFQVTEVDLRCPLRVPGGRYIIGGSGTYSIYTRDGTQDMLLDLDVSGTGGVRLASGGGVPVCPVCGPPGLMWPAIDITVTEDGSRDPLHVFTIRIVAAPRPKETVRYELVEGSTATIDCFACELANPTQAIEGFFTLGRISEDAEPIATYRVDGLHFRSGDGSIQGGGQGLYWQGGEAMLFQSMEIEAGLNGDARAILASGEVAVTADFPAIDIALELRRNRPPGEPIYLLSLHLVARLVAVPFRRGDANADGETNISDPIFILQWKFSDGAAPPCLDAADTNDDEKHDITDPIFLLVFLFQGGRTPPAPGPESCGNGATLSVGCAAYPSC